MKALKKTNEDQHKQICTKVREDGAFVEAGENDNLMVQKVTADAGTLGVLGFSYLEQNAGQIRAVKIGGVDPTEDPGWTIAALVLAVIWLAYSWRRLWAGGASPASDRERRGF